MADSLEFYFDYISPFSYVANAAVAQLAERIDVDVKFKPMFLGAVMQSTGNRPLQVWCRRRGPT